MPWPGLLVGGPNAGRQDTYMKSLAPDIPSAKMYIDVEGAYACNEVECAAGVSAGERSV